MEISGFNIDKVRAISSYLSENVSSLYVTKFYKLLYYIDFISYARRESSVTGDLYYKLPYGPVPSLIKNEIDNLSFRDAEFTSQLAKSIKLVPIEKDGKKTLIQNIAKEIKIDSLSAFELNLVKKVMVKFKNTTAAQLTARTHREAPYRLSSANSVISYEFAKKLDIGSILA